MGTSGSHKFVDQKVIIRIRDRVCESSEELFASDLFLEILHRDVAQLKKKESPLLGIFGKPVSEVGDADEALLVDVLKILSKLELDCVQPLIPEAEPIVRDPFLLNAFIESL